MACRRAHVAEAVRAILIFGSLLAFHPLFMWGLAAMYGQGLRTTHAYALVRAETDQANSGSGWTYGQGHRTAYATTDAKSSYVLLFQPHMLIAGLLILYVNVILLYQLARLFLLGPWLMQQHPIDELIQMPGRCYESCATYVFLYSYWAAWTADASFPVSFKL